MSESELVIVLRELQESIEELRKRQGIDDATHEKHHEYIATKIEADEGRDKLVEDIKNKSIGGIVVAAILGFFALIGKVAREYLKTIGIHF